MMPILTERECQWKYLDWLLPVGMIRQVKMGVYSMERAWRMVRRSKEPT